MSFGFVFIQRFLSLTKRCSNKNSSKRYNTNLQALPSDRGFYCHAFPCLRGLGETKVAEFTTRFDSITISCTIFVYKLCYSMFVEIFLRDVFMLTSLGISD